MHLTKTITTIENVNNLLALMYNNENVTIANVLESFSHLRQGTVRKIVKKLLDEKFVSKQLFKRVGSKTQPNLYHATVESLTDDEFVKLFGKVVNPAVPKAPRHRPQREDNNGIIAGARVFNFETLHEQHVAQNKLRRQENYARRGKTFIGSTLA